MKTFELEVITTVAQYVRIDAETAEDARQQWAQGELFNQRTEVHEINVIREMGAC